MFSQDVGSERVLSIASWFSLLTFEKGVFLLPTSCGADTPHSFRDKIMSSSKSELPELSAGKGTNRLFEQCKDSNVKQDNMFQNKWIIISNHKLNQKHSHCLQDCHPAVRSQNDTKDFGVGRNGSNKAFPLPQTRYNFSSATVHLPPARCFHENIHRMSKGSSKILCIASKRGNKI